MEWLIVLVAALGIPFVIAALTKRPDQTVSERATELGEALSSAGSRMSAIGCGLTLSLTLPIIGFVLGGWIGLLVGLVVGAVLSAVMFRAN
jgi:hypothetical protein